ncbi:hypothetical protein [Consotaella salsifontis]|uniref:hypothetical protein n=1 Tax=Consotaella salsifontis TaxID=1365950 RepID=UPI00099ACD22|nr:hypothetical protein [Consotaella salsifontis]
MAATLKYVNAMSMQLARLAEDAGCLPLAALLKYSADEAAGAAKWRGKARSRRRSDRPIPTE